MDTASTVSTVESISFNSDHDFAPFHLDDDDLEPLPLEASTPVLMINSSPLQEHLESLHVSFTQIEEEEEEGEDPLDGFSL